MHVPFLEIREPKKKKKEENNKKQKYKTEEFSRKTNNVKVCIKSGGRSMEHRKTRLYLHPQEG